MQSKVQRSLIPASYFPHPKGDLLDQRGSQHHTTSFLVTCLILKVYPITKQKQEKQEFPTARFILGSGQTAGSNNTTGTLCSPLYKTAEYNLMILSRRFRKKTKKNTNIVSKFQRESFTFWKVREIYDFQFQHPGDSNVHLILNFYIIGKL